MNKIKLFIIILSLGLISSTSFAEDGEEEAVQPSNPQELLEIVKQGQFADTQQQREREAQFRNEKNRQAKLLSDAKDERARLEREAARLEQKFEANEALLVVAEDFFSTKIEPSKYLLSAITEKSIENSPDCIPMIYSEKSFCRILLFSI